MPGSRRLRLAAAALGVVAAAGLLEGLACLYLAYADRHELRVFERSDAGAVHGFGVKKNFTQLWKSREFSVSVRTNNIGMRDDRDYRGEPLDIGFYGDSYTFGHGVEASERYSDRLKERLPGKRIVSFGYLDGWTTPHYYVFARDRPGWMPGVGVVGLCLDNDLTNDIVETAVVPHPQGGGPGVRPLSSEVDSRGFLVGIDVNPLNVLLRRTWSGELLLRGGFRFLRHFKLAAVEPAQPYPAPHADFDRGVLDPVARAGLYHLLKMDRLFKSRGRRLIVFLIPVSFSVGDYPTDHDAAAAADIRTGRYLPKALMKWCDEHQVECVDPTERFQELERRGTQLYFRQDPHWNAAGHQAAADVIAEYLTR